MSAKTPIALDLVLNDIQRNIFGPQPLYRLVHRNGSFVEGKVVSVSDETVQLKDAQGLIEIEKAYIARIDKLVPDMHRYRNAGAVAVTLVLLVGATNFFVRFSPEIESFLMPAAWVVAIVGVGSLRLIFRRTFGTWEEVYPPPGTVVVDDKGWPVDANQ